MPAPGPPLLPGAAASVMVPVAGTPEGFTTPDGFATPPIDVMPTPHEAGGGFGSTAVAELTSDATPDITDELPADATTAPAAALPSRDPASATLGDDTGCIIVDEDSLQFSLEPQDVLEHGPAWWRRTPLKNHPEPDAHSGCASGDQVSRWGHRWRPQHERRWKVPEPQAQAPQAQVPQGQVPQAHVPQGVPMPVVSAPLVPNYIPPRAVGPAIPGVVRAPGCRSGPLPSAGPPPLWCTMYQPPMETYPPWVTSAIQEPVQISRPPRKKSERMFNRAAGLGARAQNWGSTRSCSSDAAPWEQSTAVSQKSNAAGALGPMCEKTTSHPAKWHPTALSAGVMSDAGHVLTKHKPGARKWHDNGAQLSTLCMIFERDLRDGGYHEYVYTIMDGDVGAADGVGFVFDNKIRRNNIQKMRSVFLNRHGQICVRDQAQIWKLEDSLPGLARGTAVKFNIDLDSSEAQVVVVPRGEQAHATTVNFGDVFESYGEKAPRSGFFAAVLTRAITVSLF